MRFLLLISLVFLFFSCSYHEQEVKELLAKAQRNITKGDYNTALADLDKAVALNDVDAELYFTRGIVKAAQGKHKDALSDYNKALALKKDYAEAYFRKGMSKLSLDNDLSAKSEFYRAIQINPKYLEAYLGISEAERKLYEPDSARKYFDMAVAIDKEKVFAEFKTKFSDYYLKLLDMQIRRKRYKEALSTCDYLLANKQESAEVYNQKGFAENKLIMFWRAIADLNKSISMDSTIAEAYFNRGFAIASFGDNYSAIPDFERALKLKPDFKEAKENLAIARRNSRTGSIFNILKVKKK